MHRRKIAVVTGTRAEFGLLLGLLRLLDSSAEVELQLIVTGMHLSPEFGLTYGDIVEAGFKITKKIEILLSSDSPIGISKSMGLGLISFSEALVELQPDMVVLLGDRFEIFSFATAAMVCRVPIAHIHGGEATYGAIDEPIRHSITKMSHLHFTTTEEYRKRVIQLGERPSTVFNVGAPGLDNIFNLKLMDRTDFENAIDFKLKIKNAIITLHPATLEQNTSAEQVDNLLKALDFFGEMGLIFTKSNSDTDGRIISQVLEEYVSKNTHRACIFTSLGQVRYLSALTHVDLVIGNSSSGIIEAPSFKIPTVNIGDRQAGRIKAKNVIDVNGTKDDIIGGIKKAISLDFGKSLETMENPYGKGGASKAMYELLANAEIDDLLKKEFYDLK